MGLETVSLVRVATGTALPRDGHAPGFCSVSKMAPDGSGARDSSAANWSRAHTETRLQYRPVPRAALRRVSPRLTVDAGKSWLNDAVVPRWRFLPALFRGALWSPLVNKHLAVLTDKNTQFASWRSDRLEVNVSKTKGVLGFFCFFLMRLIRGRSHSSS